MKSIPPKAEHFVTVDMSPPYLATAVPEPSTLITSGIAALAGGTVALRRWRRERKASL